MASLPPSPTTCPQRRGSPRCRRAGSHNPQRRTDARSAPPGPASGSSGRGATSRLRAAHQSRQ
jgi:hypothetical protein